MTAAVVRTLQAGGAVAVVVATVAPVTRDRLREVLAGVTEACGGTDAPARVYLLHAGLDPLAVETAIEACPDVTFGHLHKDHYAQFQAPGPARTELLLLEALRVEGSTRTIVLPPDPGALPVAREAIGAARSAAPTGAAGAAGDGGAATAPAGHGRALRRVRRGAGLRHVLVLDGTLATAATRRRLDLALAGARPGTASLGLALQAAATTGPVQALPFTPAPEQRPYPTDPADPDPSLVTSEDVSADPLLEDACLPAAPQLDVAFPEAGPVETGPAAPAATVGAADGTAAAPADTEVTGADLTAAGLADPAEAALAEVALDGDPIDGDPADGERDLGVRGLVAWAEDLIQEGDFAAARDVLLQVVRRPRGFGGRVPLLLSRVLRATSDYRTARDVLLVSHGNEVETSRALAEEADIAWVEHDYPAAVELATYALRANLTNRKAELVLEAATTPLTTADSLPARTGDRPVLSHVAFYVSRRGNFGDVVLPPTVRESVESVTGRASWLPVHAHQVFDRERLELVNSTDGVIVGGGGLFLPDTAPNGTSGWQWNVPREHLDALRVPLGVVAVGFNLFPGQSFHGTLFRDNLIALVERAVLVGLRNHGSVDQIRSLLPARLAEKVTFLPCPTTVLRHIHPGGGSPAGPAGTGQVLINAAYDRSARRFGDDYPRFLEEMAGYVRALRDAGAEVRLAAHLPADERLVTDLRAAHDVRLPVDALYAMSIDEGYDLYRRASVVVGMRGHATMIPFGLGTPVLSLISHPKMRYFLEDIDREEWGFDVREAGFAGPLTERTLEVVAAEADHRADVAAIQRYLLAVIQHELSRFAAAVGRPVDVAGSEARGTAGRFGTNVHDARA